jgi:SAM-dependent methyltransferase
MHDPDGTPDVRPATPAERADIRGMHAANRRAWDEAAERYEGWFDEAVTLLRSGGTNDFSPRMLDLARRLAEAVGATDVAHWIEADVLDVPHELDGTADLVYTGRGSIMWLADLDAWAAVLVRLLSPTGRLVIFEGHPAEWLFDVDDEGRWIATDYDYFGGPEASRGWAPEYIDRLSIPDGDQHWKFARAWTLGQVVTAIARAGLRIDELAEHPVDWWGGHGDVAADERGRIPLSFSIVARR